MVITVDGITKDINAEQFINTFIPIELRFVGNDTLISDVQSLNRVFARVVTLVLYILIAVSPVQFSKTEAPIKFTVVGIIILISPVHPWNALL